MNEAVSILVAEDTASVREFIQRALHGEGYSVTAVSDGREALEALSKNKFSLLITDIAMPHVDGIALALKAAQTDSSMKIIMISGYAQERLKAHNLEALIFKIIAKPFSLEEICTIVSEALHSPRN